MVRNLDCSIIPFCRRKINMKHHNILGVNSDGLLFSNIKPPFMNAPKFMLAEIVV